MQLKQKNNPYLIKIEKIEKELAQTKKELNVFLSVVRDEQEMQT
jgi:hypothetical protein